MKKRMAGFIHWLSDHLRFFWEDVWDNARDAWHWILSHLCYFTKKHKQANVETLLWLRNNQKFYEGFNQIPVSISIRGFFFKKMVIHYEYLSDDQIVAYEKLSLRKKEKLQEHLSELEMMSEWSLRNAYINEVENLQSLTRENELNNEQVKDSEQTIDITTYEHFKNDFINEAKEHISEIKQLLEL